MKPSTMQTLRAKRLKLSQRKLGVMLGYSQKQISNIETGFSPMPLWMPFALSHILMFGPKDPFDEQI